MKNQKLKLAPLTVNDSRTIRAWQYLILHEKRHIHGNIGPRSGKQLPVNKSNIQRLAIQVLAQLYGMEPGENESWLPPDFDKELDFVLEGALDIVADLQLEDELNEWEKNEQET